jgi:hypothetical protein
MSFFDKLKSAGKCSNCRERLSIKDISIGTCEKCLLQKVGIPQESMVFSQMASYRGGHPKCASETKQQGKIFITNEMIVYTDKEKSFILPYGNIKDSSLTEFVMSGWRGVLGAGAVGMQMQKVKNTLLIKYTEGGVDYDIRFQIHGAASIPGEGIKAQEVINHISAFKSKFKKASEHSVSDDDLMAKLEKLAALKQKGIISEKEFEKKKAELLSQL